MNDKPTINPQTLPPLTKFIYTLGQLPSSYLMSMSFEEQLVWLCNYLATQVIPAVNQNGEAVEELQDLYELLRTYVNNYFDNLDVQEEINNKLDEMVVGGELQQLLSLQYDELRNDVNNEIEEFKSDVNNQIIAINNKVNVTNTGNPIPVTNSNQMTDTTKIYLLISDGKWYYYNGTSWVAGGTYQSTSIGDNSVYANNLEESLASSLNIEIPQITWETGYYRNVNGVKSSNNNYSASNNIELKQGDKIYMLCNAGGTAISVISNITPDGDPIVLNNSAQNVLSIGDVLNVYTFIAPYDCEVGLTIRNNNTYAYCFIEKNDDKNIVKSLLNYRIPTIEFNYHVYANNASLENNNNYFVSKPIRLYEGETIKFHARGEGNVVSLLRLVQSDGTYISTLIQTSGTREYDCEYKANTDCYVSICSNFIYFRNLIVTKDNITNEYNNEMFASFIKMGVIGDSLASGESVANNGGTTQYIDNYDYSWGQFIARNHGMKCINFSKGGANTRTWLRTDNDWGLSKLLNDDNKCNVYVIGLGINDPSIPNYLGSINDINLSDFTQNADTFYGNYAKIIGYIKQVQPKAKIFMLTMPVDYGDYLTAIRNIANLYENDVYLIDLNKDYYDEYTTGFITNNKRDGHYNAIAYNYMGELLYKALTNYMINNSEKFKQIEFIGTNYSYTS